jgi:uncharacterized membrane protein
MASDFTSLYSKFSDEELLRVATERETLSEDAKAAIDSELRRRGLEPEPALAPLHESEPPSFVEESYRGVRGWLLLFVVFLTILYPIGLAFVLPSWHKSRNDFLDIPRYLYALLIERAFVILLGALGFYTGISLWRIWPNAIRLAKTYLILVLINLVAVQFLFFIAGHSLRMIAEAFRQYWMVNVGTIAFVLVWYTYLSKSKRVATTYGAKRGR